MGSAWAAWARNAGRCLAIADDLERDGRVMASLGNRGAVRYIRSDEEHFRRLAVRADRKARNLHALSAPATDKAVPR